jgi:pyruvate,water dikinase
MTLRAPTHTRISLRLASAELSAKYAKLACDGVMLMCAESCAGALGVHPRKLLANRGEEKFLDLFSRNVVRVARDFAPRAVVYRTLDLKPDEYKDLEGGAEFERQNENQTPGLRGCARYLADEASFRLELRAVKRARDMGCVNVDAMLPSARLAGELARCREIVIQEGLFASAEFELWMMADMAENGAQIEEFLPHVSGVLIGSRDVPQVARGNGHDNSLLANQFDGRDAAGRATITHIVQACHGRGVACSICIDAAVGEAGQQVEFIRTLIAAGLTGLSVAPDSLEKTVAAVAAAEAELGILPEREVAK